MASPLLMCCLVETNLAQSSGSYGIPLHVRVLAPESPPMPPPDLRRLFVGQRLTQARRLHLARCPRILAERGGRPIGLAVYEQVGDELRVHELGIDPTAAVGAHEVAAALLDALELACLAGGGRRLVLTPRALSLDPEVELCGYHPGADRHAGAWLQKTLV